MNVPIFFYPTTFIFIDDDELFLKAISSIQFGNNSIKVFKDTKKCIEFLNKFESPIIDNSFLLDHVEDDYEFTPKSSLVNVNFPSLNQLRLRAQRQQDISCVIADYHMPGMNGIDFFSQLKELPFKKVLLTGAANFQDAVEAFNRNVIDRFIRKDMSSLEIELKAQLSYLSKQYFRDRTNHILSHLESKSKTHLTDPIFCSFFDAFCVQKRIKEFTLIDKTGSFLLIDDLGKELILAVYNEKTLDDFVEFNCDESSDNKYIQEIKQRKKIPIFGIGREGWEIESANWQNYLYASSKIEGRGTYYYAII